MSLLAHQAQLMASAGSPSGTVWDATAMGSGIVLSAGDTIASREASGWASVYATSGKASGKWQFEAEAMAGSGVGRPFVGVADKTNAANVLANYLGNNAAAVQESVGYWGNGRIYYRLSTATGEVHVAGLVVGDIFTITLDLTLGTPEMKFYKNGVLFGTRAVPAGKTWYPAGSMQIGGKVRLIPGGLSYPQAGFSDWG